MTLPQANLNKVKKPYRLHPKMHRDVRDFLDDKNRVFELIEEYGSPLNIVFSDIFKQKYELFDQLLSGEHLNYRLYYTCKPNRSNAFLTQAKRMNSYVDVSSLGEFEAAILAGVQSEKISATGPKNKKYMDIILSNQSLCVVDNFYELEYLAAKAKSDQPIMIRLSLPQESGMERDDVFGFHENELDRLFDFLIKNDCFDFHGFAVHYSGSFDPIRNRYIDYVVKTTLLAFERGLNPKAINIGGGYQVNYIHSKEDWQEFIVSLKSSVAGIGPSVTWDNAGLGFRLHGGDLAGSANFIDHYQSTTGENHLQQILYAPVPALDGGALVDFIRDSGLSLYVEPGRALMDQAGITLATVNFVKESSQGVCLVNLDANHSSLNAQIFKGMAEPVILKRDSRPVINEQGVIYYGSLCFSTDLITHHKTYPDYLPEADDVVAFINTAGYRMDFAESEMLRHPTAKKICAMKKDEQWIFSLDDKYIKGQ